MQFRGSAKRVFSIAYIYITNWQPENAPPVFIYLGHQGQDEIGILAPESWVNNISNSVWSVALLGRCVSKTLYEHRIMLDLTTLLKKLSPMGASNSNCFPFYYPLYTKNMGNLTAKKSVYYECQGESHMWQLLGQRKIAKNHFRGHFHHIFWYVDIASIAIGINFWDFWELWNVYFCFMQFDLF